MELIVGLKYIPEAGRCKPFTTSGESRSKHLDLALNYKVYGPIQLPSRNVAMSKTQNLSAEMVGFERHRVSVVVK